MKDNVLNKIAKIVADEFEVDVEYIFQNTRKHKVTDIRSIFHYMAHKYTSKTLQKIGDYSMDMGRGEPHNHATVLYGYQKCRRLIDVDKEFRENVKNIQDKVERQLTYERYVNKKSSLVITSIIDRIFYKTDYEYLESVDTLLNLLYFAEDKNDINKLIAIQKATNEGIHQAPSDDSGLGVV